MHIENQQKKKKNRSILPSVMPSLIFLFSLVQFLLSSPPLLSPSFILTPSPHPSIPFLFIAPSVRST
ncbi:hypothetical protein K457DRAFT_645107 [Linnemannia elongata AG-77]|uniref:Uncharacterized protein n=1 Tax=Linnemannia elongata AG-77 TaxID=1314771 RepID=A0A197KF69_9FUNG|nr:hypothetical protein K457DRAFT_645107 [Linnemannia elongata AG-77]